MNMRTKRRLLRNAQKHGSTKRTWIIDQIFEQSGQTKLKAAWRAKGNKNSLFCGKSGYDNLLRTIQRFCADIAGRSAKLKLATYLGFASPVEMQQAWEQYISQKNKDREDSSAHTLDSLTKLHEDTENHEQAIHFLLKFHGIAGQEPSARRASIRKRLGTQFKHIGELNKADEWYTKAKTDIESIDAHIIDEQSRNQLLLSLDFSEAMLGWFRTGNTKKWVENIERMKEQIHIYKSNCEPETLVVLNHRFLHLQRQKAEALRNLGNYSDADSLAQQLIIDYKGLFSGESAAWCRVIELDSKRLLIKSTDKQGLKDLIQSYRDLERISGLHGWKKLATRCRKGMIDIEISLETFKYNQEVGDYLFAKIYENILYGRALMSEKERKYDAAEEKFADALNIIRNRQQGCLLEKGIAEFGIAETKRLRAVRTSDPKFKEAKEAYQRLKKTFSIYGCQWGELRCNVALRLMNGEWEAPTSCEGRDSDLMKRYLGSRKISYNQPDSTLFDAVL